MKNRRHASLLGLFLPILLVSGLFASGLFVSGGAYAAAAQTDADKETIRVLILKSFPPQFVTTPDGPSGLAVEVMQNVAQRAGLDIDFVTVESWPQVYPLLKSKSVDVLSNMGISDARRKIVEFTEPYEVFDIKLFVRDDTEGLETFDDLGERRLGVHKTNVLTKNIVQSGKYNTKAYPSFQALLFGLLAGEVDAIVAPTEPFLLLARGIRLDDRIKFVGPSLLEIKRAMALPKGATHLRDRLNTALTDFKATREYQALLVKWYGAPTPYWTRTKIAILSGMTIVVLILAFGMWRYFVMVGFNRRIRKSEAKLSAHIENTPLAAISWDRAFRCTEWNHAAQKIFGYSADEAIGRHASEILVPANGKDDIENIYQSLLEQQGGTRSTNQNCTKDGRIITCDWYNTPITDLHGEVIGVASLAHDITRRARAQEEIKQHRDHLEELVSERTAEVYEKAVQLETALTAEKKFSALQQQFVSLVSHEFRNPLSIIDGAAQRMIRSKDKISADEIGRRGTTIRMAVERMVGLIDTTLYAENLDRGNFPFTPDDCDLKTIIRIACEHHVEAAPDHDIRTNIEGLPSMITADRKLLNHTFQNLLSNAIKYSPGHSSIKVKGWTEGDFALVAIEDHGVGIPTDDLPNLFQRFFRARTAQGIRGTGLGLNVCKQFVEMHGGDIKVESVEGEGTTFTVKLPIAGVTVSQTSG